MRLTYPRIGVLAVVIALLTPTPAGAAESIQVAIDAPFADPTFTAADGAYYAYSTGGDGQGGGFPVASADSMTGPWTVHTAMSMPTKPAWVGQNPQGAYNYWAPSVFRNDAGTFVMYSPPTTTRPIAAASGWRPRPGRPARSSRKPSRSAATTRAR